MRVLVLSEAVGDLSPGTSGAAVARGWAALGHQVAVVPLAAAGAGVAAAVADLTGGQGDRRGAPAPADVVVVGDPGPHDGSSAGLGGALAVALATGPDEIWLDLATSAATDAGEGLVVRLAGPDAGSAADPALVAAGRVRLGRTRLVGVVPQAETGAELTGLRGVASLAAATERAAGGAPAPIAELLRRDTALALVATRLGLEDPPRGAGAVRGLGLAVLALGGQLTSAPAALGSLARVGRTVESADLLVVVADEIDFGDAGGEVVAAARSWAEAALLPCVAVCGEVRISARELRTLGIEAAYGLPAGASPSEESLAVLGRRVAATWSWPSGNRRGRAGVDANVD